MIVRIHIEFKINDILVFKDVFCSKETVDINFFHLKHRVEGFIDARSTLIEFIPIRFTLNAEMNKCIAFKTGKS
jgi:hypothetical protein